ncbi:GNAT family N-acetyltransferase [archaeon]|nr:GNAT family N-acetyltransferase [archaeon]
MAQDWANIFQVKGIFYKTLPALKIGRICVHSEYSGRGIGTHMIDFATVKAFMLSEEVGCRFISTDAKRDAIHFYKKNGFEILRTREKGTIPMYFDLVKQLEIRNKRII